MTDHSPNDAQEQFIETTEGPVLVDAGAGTGKTFAITQRYVDLLADRTDPQDILLLTFTRNAAENMKERINAESDRRLHDAPISTFHAYCRRLVADHGTEGADMLGLDADLSPSASVLENTIQERQEFERFYSRFQENKPEHEQFYRLVSGGEELLDLIKALASRGIFPAEEGWYRDGRKHLRGDREAFMERFHELNEPGDGARGPTHSRLSTKAYSRMRSLVLPEDAPERSELRDGKQIDPALAEEAFDGDRDDLFRFIHDIYRGYIEYALRRNYLTFPFILMFAFVVLCEDDELRQDRAFEHVMIDEFQDTNEIQLKIAMLLSGTGNIAAVGDWKQSIYSFQYTDVENILVFDDRLKQFKHDLNADRERIQYPVTEVTELGFRQNYRSTQQILDDAEQALTLAGTSDPSRDRSLDAEIIEERLISLKANNDSSGEVGKILAEDEPAAVLGKLQSIVDSPDHSLPDGDGGRRRIRWDDIAILTRTQAFALDLQREAGRYDIPLAYEGGVRLFQTDPGIMLLAWLRVLNWEHSRKGWAVILEEAGYTIDEIETILGQNDYPQDMLAFRENLRAQDSIPAQARLVFQQYGMTDGFGDRIVDVLHSTLEGSYMDLGQLISFIEDTIEEGETYDVDTSTSKAMATVQTIHASKGLEYPVVVVADVNRHRFPDRNQDGGRIRFNDPIGLRQTKVYRDRPPYEFDDWHRTILDPCRDNRGYDEERRLLYVAMTRAQNYLYLTAEKGRASPFFEIDLPDLDGDRPPVPEGQESSSGERFDIDRPDERAPLKLSVHALMDDLEETAGKGPDFGRQVHRFTEDCIKGRGADPQNEDEQRVDAFLERLEGEVRSEVPMLLPLETTSRRYSLSGTIDILHVTDETVEIIDLKTDRERTNRDGYRKQLSAYLHAVEASFPEKDVTASILWTSDGDLDAIEPAPKDRLAYML